MKQTQNKRVLDYIERWGSISTLEAFQDLGITRLASRIFELKQMGYQFDKERETSKNRFGEDVCYVRYSLIEEEEEEEIEEEVELTKEEWLARQWDVDHTDPDYPW